MKRLPDYEDASTRSTRDITKEDGFYRALVKFSSAKKDGHGTVYRKDETDVLSKKLEIYKKGRKLFSVRSKKYHCQQYFLRVIN